MSRRMPPRQGEWIDRNQPIEFQFEGTAYHGFTGDVLSSALWANDVRMLGRSFKYHRPRGIYSLAGHDVNVMVEDGTRTNLRGDLLPITPELNARAVNTAGSLLRDRMRITEWFSRLLPVGFYYKAFHTPRRLFPFYEKQMRKVAGLGRINPNSLPVDSPKQYSFCDVLVVGSGPAGLAAAVAAGEQGLDVVLVDENAKLGGSFHWQWPDNSELLAEYEQRLVAMGNINVRCGTQAAGWYADHRIALVDDKRLTKLRAEAVIVATGCFEQPAVFQNNDVPGVMLGSAAQRLIYQYSIRPFDRAVVLAANHEGYRLALDLHSAGVQVAALVDPRPDQGSHGLKQAVSDAGIEVLLESTIREVTTTAGKMRVRGAVVSDRTGQSKLLACDGIAQSVGWAPNAALIYQSGGRMSYDEAVHQLVPRQLSAGVFCAGRVNGHFALKSQVADGRRAGLAAASYLDRYPGQVPAPEAVTTTAHSHPYPIVEHKGKKNFVDLDEDLHLADFVNAHQEGFDNIELLKRYTTVGMGPSQGKLANMNAIRILAHLNGSSIDETGSTTSRPFYQPVPIGVLAGRRFHPVRRTPMHDWHTRSGAKMIHAGDWLRPEYYDTNGTDREQQILEEAVNVRRGAGLIDVGTLGKLDICGPDAARFIEQVYTGNFTRQRIGRLRYGLACDETGVIIEDGVVARLADDQFYVTATSSGVGAFFRELQRWALLLKADIRLINATGQRTAMNLAGPHSRIILQQLTDLDLAAAAFDYLGVRTATVAGVPAILMRVGFVGELGYEIHVAAAHGQHVWSEVLKAGEQHGIRPFGIESQRLLRLEKGHLIVGQDTDALTTPLEANAAWAIGKRKPFFVGSRSLQIAGRKRQTRQLVGLVFPSDHAGQLPEECNLIIADGEIVGRITSIAKKTTIGHAIAMAFLLPEMTEPGTRVAIRLDNGRDVQAIVSAMPFYDPKNERQQS